MQSNFDEVGIYNVIAVDDFVHWAGVKGESMLSVTVEICIFFIILNFNSIFNLIIKWEYRRPQYVYK